MNPEQQLENQLCFPIYSLAKQITKAYTPYLKPHKLSYTQYLVLLVLWEQDSQTIGQIGEKLLLETSTLSPLLSRMEKRGLVIRKQDKVDERVKYIVLTKKGADLQDDLKEIPWKIYEKLAKNGIDLGDFRKNIDICLQNLSN